VDLMKNADSSSLLIFRSDCPGLINDSGETAVAVVLSSYLPFTN
jgi:hypothetical protein